MIAALNKSDVDSCCGWIERRVEKSRVIERMAVVAILVASSVASFTTLTFQPSLYSATPTATTTVHYLLVELPTTHTKKDSSVETKTFSQTLLNRGCGK